MTFIILSILSCSDKVSNKKNSLNNLQYSSLVDLVNPLISTDSKFSLSNGNTYPAIATPWGVEFSAKLPREFGLVIRGDVSNMKTIHVGEEIHLIVAKNDEVLQQIRIN